MDDRDRAFLDDITGYAPGGPRQLVLWTVLEVPDDEDGNREQYDDVELTIEVGVNSLNRATLTQTHDTGAVQQTLENLLDDVTSVELVGQGLVLRGQQEVVTDDGRNAGWLPVTWYCSPTA